MEIDRSSPHVLQISSRRRSEAVVSRVARRMPCCKMLSGVDRPADRRPASGVSWSRAPTVQSAGWTGTEMFQDDANRQQLSAVSLSQLNLSSQFFVSGPSFSLSPTSRAVVQPMYSCLQEPTYFAKARLPLKVGPSGATNLGQCIAIIRLHREN
jgi:hypothetical protein